MHLNEINQIVIFINDHKIKVCVMILYYPRIYLLIKVESCIIPKTVRDLGSLIKLYQTLISIQVRFFFWYFGNHVLYVYMLTADYNLGECNKFVGWEKLYYTALNKLFKVITFNCWYTKRKNWKLFVCSYEKLNISSLIFIHKLVFVLIFQYH